MARGPGNAVTIRRLLELTVVFLTGDFGGIPPINPRRGRDHDLWAMS